MEQDSKPQIQIDGISIAIKLDASAEVFFVELQYGERYEAKTIDRLISDLRWAGKSLKFLTLPDDRKIDVCYIFAWQPASPDSEEFWMARDEEVAVAKVEQLKLAHPHFVRWRFEPCRIDLESWRMHRLSRSVDDEPRGNEAIA